VTSHSFRRVVGVGVHFVWLSSGAYISFLLVESNFHWFNSFGSVPGSGSTLVLGGYLGARGAREGPVSLGPHCAVPPTTGFHFTPSDYKNHIRFDEFHCRPHCYILIEFPFRISFDEVDKKRGHGSTFIDTFCCTF